MFQDLPAWVGVEHIFHQPGLAQVSDKRVLALLHCHLRCGVVFSWLSAVRLWALSTTSLALLCPTLHILTSTLWDLMDFGRGGRRGYNQKAAFIRGGLQQGFLSNSYPYILDKPRLGGATFRKPVIQQEYEAQHQSTAASSRSVRPRLEDHPKTFKLSSTPGAGGTWFLWTPDPEFIFRSVDHLDLRGVTRASKFLFIDWHQVFNRSRTGDAHFFGRAPHECVDTVVKTARLGEALNKPLFVAIVSYIDTDRRVNEVIEFLNATDCTFHLS